MTETNIPYNVLVKTVIPYENWHKHTKYSNVFTPDSILSVEDIAKRAVELGQKTLSTVEHGYAGNIFEYKSIADKYGLKLVFGVEFYYVKDRFEKDRTNSHLLVMAKNDRGRKALTKLISEANETGYYYKPRIDESLLFSLNPEDVVVTSTCIASPYNLYDDYECFITQCHDYFKDNFFLEIHDNTNWKQVEFNKKIKKLNQKYNIPYVFATDTHYIHPEDSVYRDDLLRGKGIFYDEEEGFIMDYPTAETALERFAEQGVFTREEVLSSFENTLIARDFEELVIDKEIKMPTLYPDETHEGKIKMLKTIVNGAWIEDRKHIPKERHKEYLEAIKFEMSIIENTKMEDYFLLNYEVIKRAKELGGILTRTGRGSAPSFYLNKLLGFTEVDRLDAPIELFPTRFMSESRILQTVSLPDIDFNCADPKPFIQATRELLGENNCYYMTAFGTMQESEAFRNLCRARGISATESNVVAKDLDTYRKNATWSSLIEESSKFVGAIDSVSPHPCFLSGTLVNTKDGYKNIEDIEKGDYVLTHTNKYKKVVETMNRNVSEYYDLKLQGSPSTLVTGNHPYFVKERTIENGKRKFSDAKWKSVEELKKGDFVGYAINQEEMIPYEEGLPTHKEEFWWLMGRYLGDGWWKNERPNNKQQGEYNTIICCGKHELGQIEEYAEKLSSYFNFYKTEERTTFRYNFLSKKLWNFVKENMGKGSKDKFISSKILNLPKDLLKSFVDGYISADGHVLKGNKVTITTTSKQVAYAIQQCIIKSYHTSASLTKIMRKDSILEGRLLKGNLQYIITFKEEARTIAYIEDDYIWMPFRDKVKVYSDATVYNMEVEDDHSYTANNVIVHNCACLLMTEDIREEVGIIRVGDELCAVVDSYYSDVFKFLKNDYLSVTVWKIIGEAFEKTGMEIPDVRQLSELVAKDDKVWDLYKDGIVATLNQAGTTSGKPQVMQYSPRSIRELSGWVSAIRPSFSSMKAYFLNREPFSYGIPTFDKILESSDNFVLYQENIMSALVYVGFPEDETYGLLKAIAKKKEGIIEPIHDKFIDGFKQRVIEEDKVEEEVAQEQALKVWKIIEDAVGYGFNSSHAYSVALDSVYGAYLKANFPLDYYATVLDIYQGDTSKTGEIVKELPYFGIKLRSIEYGKSGGDYNSDAEDNSVYKGIASIKFLNKKIGDDLLELSKNEEVSNLSWVDFCQYILENKVAQSNQMKILINLDFFKKFGKRELLLELYLVMTGNKDVSLIKFPEFAPKTIQIEKRNRKKEIRYEDKIIKRPLKYDIKHKDDTKNERMNNLREFYELLSERPPKDVTLYEQIAFEKEYLGYAYSKWEDLDSKICLVLDINKKYTPLCTLYQVSTGKEFNVKVKKKNFWLEDEIQMLYEGDIILIKDLTKEEGWKQVDGKWERNPDKMELHLNKCSLVRNSPLREKLTN